MTHKLGAGGSFLLWVIALMGTGLCLAAIPSADMVTIALERKLLPNSSTPLGMMNVFFEKLSDGTVRLPAAWADVKIAKIVGNPAVKPVNAVQYSDETGIMRIVVDTDSDGEWSDEHPLVFEKSGDLSFADFEISFVPAGGAPSTTNPVAYQLIRSDAYVYVRIREYRTGTLRLGGESYGVFLRPQNRDAMEYGTDRTLFFIDADQNGEIAQYWSEQKDGGAIPSEEVSLSQPFVLAGRKFEADSLDPAGTRLVLKPTSAEVAVAPGFIAPGFQAQDLEGQLQRLQDLRGRVVLLEFWSVDCPWGDSVRPLINGLGEKFKGPNFVALSIARESDPKILRDYLKEKPKSTTIFARQDEVWTTYNPRGLTPFCLVLDREGVIRLIAPGARAQKALEAAIAGSLHSQKESGGY